jgi:hypothetical protein
LICGERLRIGEGEVELEVVPVCGGCEDGGLEGEGVEREIDRRDGGMGKARLERLMESNYGCVSNETLSGVAQAQVGLEAASRSRTSAAAESTSYYGDPGFPTSPPPVYITITDPINGPSFKPSPMKPIPRWMRQLPNGREREQVHLPATPPFAVAESEVDMLPIENTKDVLAPSLQAVPEEQQPPSLITHVSAAASAIPESILAYNDRRMTMSTPPKMRHQRLEYGARAGTPFYTGEEMGVEYLKRYHLRALEERERGLQETKRGNVALERVRKLGSVKQIVDRAKSMQMEILSEEEGQGDGQRWGGKEMLRKELSGLFRQG